MHEMSNMKHQILFSEEKKKEKISVMHLLNFPIAMYVLEMGEYGGVGVERGIDTLSWRQIRQESFPVF